MSIPGSEVYKKQVRCMPQHVGATHFLFVFSAAMCVCQGRLELVTLVYQLAISCSAIRISGRILAVTHFLQLPICYYGNSSSPCMELSLLQHA